ncbi:MAG TPA: hypothetical protein VF989_17510 [Polyangiaceae bacterium]
MTPRSRARVERARAGACLGIFAALSCLACGAEFDPPSEVNTLRVLAVQKDQPYAQPGDSVELSLLWHDGAPDADRDISRVWVSGCFNPLGDAYFGCFATLAEGDGDGDGSFPESVIIGSGDSFAFQVPDDIITSRPPPLDPLQPRYGLAIVFFAACAGRLEVFAPEQAGALPLRCLDEANQPLGPDDFVVGYTNVFVYESFENQNATVTGFEVAGTELAADGFCIGADCVDTNPPEDEELDCPDDPRCVAACSADGDPDCPEVPVRPIVAEESAEADSVAREAYGRDLTEQMWINYYVSRGSVSSPVRLLNDATTGWNPEYESNLLAPREPGPLLIWAVVHDNRGGVEWARARVEIY